MFFAATMLKKITGMLVSFFVLTGIGVSLAQAAKPTFFTGDTTPP
jgi:preprotein translocase subunit SecG